MTGRFEDRRELILTELLGGLHHDDERLVTRACAPYGALKLVGPARERLGNATDRTTSPVPEISR